MGGQIWGGGVIVFVAVALWMLYLLPSWRNHHQYTSAERNAVRLNQALRVLAETSETPAEVKIELNARTVLAQQRLARKTLAEQEQVGLAQARAEHETARAHAAVAREDALREAAAARATPAARRARVRRAARIVATVLLLAGLVSAGLGAWTLIAGAGSVLLCAGGVLSLLTLVFLQRMARVSARSFVRAVPQVSVVPQVQDVVLPVEQPRPTWQPRRLPQPLSSAQGSRAAAVLDGAAAQAALREAAWDEVKRERAEKVAPPSIAAARTQRERSSASPYTSMGYVDDAEIEAHVRQLLEQRRVAG